MIVTSPSFTNNGNIPKTQIIPEGLPAGGKITSPITAIQGHILAETQISGRLSKKKFVQKI